MYAKLARKTGRRTWKKSGNQRTVEPFFVKKGQGKLCKYQMLGIHRRFLFFKGKNKEKFHCAPSRTDEIFVSDLTSLWIADLFYQDLDEVSYIFLSALKKKNGRDDKETCEYLCTVEIFRNELKNHKLLRVKNLTIFHLTLFLSSNFSIGNLTIGNLVTFKANKSIKLSIVLALKAAQRRAQSRNLI